MKRNITIKLDRKSSIEFTPEGYLVCDAAATRAGVFDYRDDKGNLVRELRPPEEVFADESLASLAMQPITFLHPQEELVTVNNIRGLQVGVTGENITHDGEVVFCRVKITDKAVIEYVKERHARGKSVELSCGYRADVEPVAGEHAAEGRYDAVQKNIRYNHLAIVGKGRAGEKVKLKLDSKEGRQVFTFIRKALKMDGFTMDAIEAEVPKEAQSVLQRMSAKIDEAVDVIKDKAARIVDLTKKADEAQARIDTLTEENTGLKADNAALADPAGEKIQAIIADRKALEETAQKLEIKTDALDNKAVKVAVIQKVSPDFKADGRSDDYINARYDSVVEMVDKAKADSADTALGKVIADAAALKNEQKADHRAQFIKQSQELADA